MHIDLFNQAWLTISMIMPDWLDRAGWPYAPRFLALADGRLHYVDEGTGDMVVLVHGTPTWSYEWRHVIARLKGAHRMVALDHLGFGLSERPAGVGYAPEDHARRFRAAMAQLAPTDPLTLVVHDFGGPIALDWALDHTARLTRLVVVNSWMWSFGDDPSMRRKAAMLRGALGRWLYRRLNVSQRLIMPSAYGDRRLLTAAIHEQYLRLFPDADSREQVLFALAKSLLGSRLFFDRLWQRRGRLAGVPVHFLWGMRDSAFPSSFLERWQQAVPHAHTTRIDAAGHWPHEEQPEAFVRALQAVWTMDEG
jgi:haloalkane dehalogenase